MLSLLKSVFTDITYIYKNFWHWILSKVTISIFRYVLAFLFVLPLVILLIITVIISPYSFLEYEKIIQDILIAFYALWGNFLWFSISSFIITLLLLGITILWLVAVFYNRILLAKLNLSYIAGERLDYKKNLYFDKKVFIKYLQLSWLFLGCFFFFICIFGIGALILFFVFWWMPWMDTLLNNSWENNWFSITSFIYFIICLWLFLYFIYRLFFSFFILVEDNKNTVKHCIKKSFTITKWYKKLLKFLGLILVFYIIYIPCSYVSQVIDFNSKSISYYIGMKQHIWVSQPTEKLTWDEFYAYTQLQQKYGNLTEKELIGKQRFMGILQWIYAIFHFVFLYGVLDMLVASFYRRELLKK